MIVTFADLRACRFCSHGARDWFKRHELDYLSFVKHGLPAETLLATGDALAERVVDQAKTRLGVDDGR